MEVINLIKGKYSSLEEFLKEQGPTQLIVNYDDVTKIYQVFSKTQITLEIIDNCFQESRKNSAVEYLSEWLLMLNDFLNINKVIPAKSIRQLAYMLYKKHSQFTLADLKLLFEFILESKYGVFYGSVDTQTIITSFAQYSRERRNEQIKIEEQARRDEAEKSRNSKEGVPVDLQKYPNIAAFLRS